ncbi:hypothetical protein PR048_014429 [Dryococelus australis]|uniref:Uncharacterized protein n=1 Tax=Dryococelus australis TaxID=614101 RepID=A0ABQ9HE70_9NEOP|nr:hypothetical protein PR048_014429 [Dryococelus australis]
MLTYATGPAVQSLPPHDDHLRGRRLLLRLAIGCSVKPLELFTTSVSRSLYARAVVRTRGGRGQVHASRRERCTQGRALRIEAMVCMIRVALLPLSVAREHREKTTTRMQESEVHTFGRNAIACSFEIYWLPRWPPVAEVKRGILRGKWKYRMVVRPTPVPHLITRQLRITVVWPPTKAETGSIPGGVTPGCSYVGIVPDNAAGRRVFSGIPRFCRRCILELLHFHIVSSSSALKTSFYHHGIIRIKTHHYMTTVGNFAAHPSNLFSHPVLRFGACVALKVQGQGFHVIMLCFRALPWHSCAVSNFWRCGCCRRSDAHWSRTSPFVTLIQLVHQTLHAVYQLKDNDKENHAITIEINIVIYISTIVGIVTSNTLIVTGATVAERLARSPSTKANRDQSPGSRNRAVSHVSPATSFRRLSTFISITLAGSQDLAVKSRPDFFTSLILTIIANIGIHPPDLIHQHRQLARAILTVLVSGVVSVRRRAAWPYCCRLMEGEGVGWTAGGCACVSARRRTVDPAAGASLPSSRALLGLMAAQTAPAPLPARRCFVCAATADLRKRIGCALRLYGPAAATSGNHRYAQGLAASALAFYKGELDSIPGGVALGYLHVVIMPDNPSDQWIFWGIFRFPRPCIQARSSIHLHLVSPSSALKTSFHKARFQIMAPNERRSSLTSKELPLHSASVYLPTLWLELMPLHLPLPLDSILKKQDPISTTSATCFQGWRRFTHGSFRIVEWDMPNWHAMERVLVEDMSLMC